MNLILLNLNLNLLISLGRLQLRLAKITMTTGNLNPTKIHQHMVKVSYNKLGLNWFKLIQCQLKLEKVVIGKYFNGHD